jgi:hypothetical protein
LLAQSNAIIGSVPAANRRNLIVAQQTDSDQDPMPSAGLVAIVFGIVIAAAPALAQSAARPPAPTKPFAAVRVKLPPPPNDASFAAFRQNLAAVAKRRVFAELARNVTPQGFFWDRDFAKSFDPRRTGAENLAAAIRLEHGSGTGWQMLAEFAAEPTASAMPAAPGVLCAPGRPNFDQGDFDRLIDATRSSPTEWVYPRATSLELRAAPRLTSAVIETLGSYFIRVIRFETAPANADPLHTSWTRIAAPSGKVGYAAPDTLNSPAAPQLCYVKDVIGRWTIAGFIGGGN